MFSHKSLRVRPASSLAVVFGVTALSLVCGSWAQDTKSVAHLTAAQIVDKNVAARGGSSAWRAVQTLTWSGKMDAGSADSAERSARYIQDNAAKSSKKELAALSSGKGNVADAKQVQLPFTLSMERPHKSRLELEFAGKTAVQVFDGSTGWKLRPFLNRNEVEPLNEAEIKSEAKKPELDGPLVDYAAKGTKVELAGTEPVEGNPAYKLKITAKNGDVQHIWIDAQSFLDVKVEGSPRRMDGRMHGVWVYQRDFRTVQGVTMPFVLETAVDGYRETHKIVIEKVTVNPKLDDSLFAKPKV
jgi:outer membrane lipoprotein-sorting protein